MQYFPYVTFKPILAYIRGYDPQTCVIEMCAKGQIVFEFSLMWIWVTFSWPSICLEIAQIWLSITPLKHYIRNPLDTLKEEELKSKRTIVHCCRSLYLSLHPFVPWSTFLLFPRFPFACELAIKRWRIEVVEDSVSPSHRSVDKVCHYCIFDLLIEISFPVQFMFVLNVNIESMDVFNCLYMVDYIC